MARDYFCHLCERSDLPVTDQLGVDTTVRDHLRIWHPDEWATVDYDFATGRMTISPTGEQSDGPDAATKLSCDIPDCDHRRSNRGYDMQPLNDGDRDG